MQRGKAYRRHQSERRKSQMRRFLRNVWQEDEEWITPRMVGLLARTPAPCSCYLCGHRREMLGPTRQERAETIEAHSN